MTLIALWIHSFSYRLVSSLAVRQEGAHPKHRLMKYKEWFLDQLSPDDVVLDIGSNKGAMPKLFSNVVSFVYGVEIRKDLTEIAKSTNSAVNVEFIHADAILIDYAKLRPISVVTLSNVLEHIDKRQEFLKILVKQINWHDSGSRRFLIRVPMIDRDWITLYKKEMGMEWRLDSSHFIEYTFDDFQSELALSGIEIDSYQIRFGEIYACCRAS